MKKNYLNSVFTVVALAAMMTAGIRFNTTKHYTARSASDSEKSVIAGAISYYKMVRNNPVTGTLDVNDVQAALNGVNQLANASNKTSALSLAWQEIGPDNVGGRTRAILIDKQDATGNTLYAGGVSGGLWKSVNGGLSWIKFAGFDWKGEFSNANVTAICQAPNNDIYVGTGEFTYSPIRGAPNGDNGTSFIGGGMYKMPAGGSSFSVITSTQPVGNATSNTAWASIQKIAISPSNSSRIYVATNKGLQVTDDGGDTWFNPIYNSNTTYDGSGVVTFAGGTKTLTAPGNTVNQNFADDVDVASDGTVLASVGDKGYISSSGNDDTYNSISNLDENTINTSVQKGLGSLPKDNLVRSEFAFAPSDPNYIYALIAADTKSFNSSTGVSNTIVGRLKNVYRSTDKGQTWTIIGYGGSPLFEPFGEQAQGDYDNCIAVHPTNKDKIIFGGIEYYSWQLGGNCNQISTQSGGAGFAFYVHADAQTILFHPTNPDVCYFGTDGGIFKSSNIQTANPTYTNSNHGYNVTQFYAVAYGKNGEMMGGAQDNGTQYIDYIGGGYAPNKFSADQVMGGDGFGCEMSNLSPKGFFASTYYSMIRRSSNGGGSFTMFYDEPASTDQKATEDANMYFNSVVRLWESSRNVSSRDSLRYVIPAGGVAAGTKVPMLSKTASYPFTHEFTEAHNAGDTVYVQDVVQSRIALPMKGGIWFCNDPLDYFKAGNWTKIAKTTSTAATVIDVDGNSITPSITNSVMSGGSSQVMKMSFSSDGNYLFFCMSDGGVYVVKNLNTIKRNSMDFYPPGHPNLLMDKATGEIGNPKSALVCTKIGGGFPGTPTDVAVDPKDANTIIVTIGNYGITNHVYKCSNATTASSSSNTSNFTNITGSLPPMPVYGAVIDYSNADRIILATEYGMYGSSDGGGTWEEENGGMERIPVHMVRQQTTPWHLCTNSGELYLGTHGRGFYKSNTLLGLKEEQTVKNKPASNGLVFPNPVVASAQVNYTLAKNSDVSIKMYDIQGRVVRQEEITGQRSGLQSFSFEKAQLQPGTYFISIKGEELNQVSKFVVSE